MPVGWLCASVYFSLQRSPAHQWRVQQTLSIRFLAYCQLQGHQRRVDLSPDALAEVYLRWTGPFSKEQSLVQCNSFTALDTIFNNVRIPEIFTPTVRHCSHKPWPPKRAVNCNGEGCPICSCKDIHIAHPKNAVALQCSHLTYHFQLCLSSPNPKTPTRNSASSYCTPSDPSSNS